MSHEARHWAWSRADLSTSARLLLVALAEHVRDGTTCFPGQARLAAMCGISERQVRNLLRELQVRGLITVEHRAGQGSGRRSNLYRLAQECRVCARDTRRVDPSPPGLAQGDGLLCPGSPCGPSRTRLPVGPPGTTVPTNGSTACRMRSAYRLRSFGTTAPSLLRQYARADAYPGLGAADKAAIQLVKVQPCQLLVTDM